MLFYDALVSLKFLNKSTKYRKSGQFKKIITTALRISETQLKQWRRLFEVINPVHFIILPALDETTTLLASPDLLINPVDIQVSFANGHAITLNGIADICMLESLIMVVIPKEL